MLAAFVLAALTCHGPDPKPVRTIHGIFVEVDDASWKPIAQSKQIDTIVIANIRGYGAGCNPCDKVKFEQARRLLDTARKGMKIYVGLVYDANFDVMTSDGARERRAAHDFYQTLTDKQKARITGWYIAGEWHNSAKQNYADAVVRYLNAATERKTADKPLPAGEVIVAPFFVARTQPSQDCTTALGVEETAVLFGDVIRRAPEVTVLLLQDGFGARNKRECKWGDNIDAYATTAKEYADAIRQVLPKGMYAVDLEAFGNTGKKQCRLDLQFANVPQGTRVIVYERRACRATKLCQ